MPENVVYLWSVLKVLKLKPISELKTHNNFILNKQSAISLSQAFSIELKRQKFSDYER
jgi:hypothetical protein